MIQCDGGDAYKTVQNVQKVVVETTIQFWHMAQFLTICKRFSTNN